MPAAKGPNRVAFKGPNNRNNRGWVVGMPGWGRGAASSRGERKIRLGKLKERGTRRGEPWFGGRPYRGLCGVFAWGPVPGKPVTGSGRVQHQRATPESDTGEQHEGCNARVQKGSNTRFRGIFSCKRGGCGEPWPGNARGSRDGESQDEHDLLELCSGHRCTSC